MADKKKPVKLPMVGAKKVGKKPLFPHKAVGKQAGRDYMKNDAKSKYTSETTRDGFFAKALGKDRDQTDKDLNKSNTKAFQEKYKNDKKVLSGLDLGRIRSSRRTGV